MSTAKDSNGERLFSCEDFLTSQQISSYFSRLASRQRVEVDQLVSEDETPEENLQSMLNEKVWSEVSIQHSHPIIYDSYNICDLMLSSKLSSFSVSMLRNINLWTLHIANFGQRQKAISGLVLKPCKGLQLLHNSSSQ